jgi:hypothetical protein
LDAYERDLRASLISLSGDVDGQLDAMLQRARAAFLAASGEAVRAGAEGGC